MTRWVIVFVLFSVLLSGCGDPKPSVLLISVDSMRADELGLVFEGENVTPEMSALAEESLVFESATSTAPWTTPAMMSVHTGMLPSTHRVDEHDRTLASSVETLAERFRAAGYRTAAFVPAITLHSHYGFEKGFDTWVFRDFGHMLPSSTEMTSFVLNWATQWRDQPSLIWVHMWDPHYNYIPTKTSYDGMFQRGVRPTGPHGEDVQCLKWVENPIPLDEAQYLRGRYESELRYTDQHIGSMIDYLREEGLLENTIVAIVGDHGEAFLEHGWMGHTNRVDEVLVHVPLLIRAPNRAPARIERAVSTASLGRTLLEMTGVDDDFGLLPALPQTDDDPISPAISSTVRRGCYTSIRDDRYKAVLNHRDCTWQLFDLLEDPGEQRDVSSAQTERVMQLSSRLRDEIERGRSAKVPVAALPTEIVEQAGDALRSLGYIAGGGGGDDDDGGEFRCELMPRPDRLSADTFGDLGLPDECPDDGAMACLSR